jgi:hypothetical protein
MGFHDLGTGTSVRLQRRGWVSGGKDIGKAKFRLSNAPTTFSGIAAKLPTTPEKKKTRKNTFLKKSAHFTGLFC